MDEEFMLTLPSATQKRDQEVTQVHWKKIFCTTYMTKEKISFPLPSGIGRTFFLYSHDMHIVYRIEMIDIFDKSLKYA